jgi:subtilisin family serine protease
VINNSWSVSGSAYSNMPWFSSIVDAWQSVGIIPVFSAGNQGSDGCGSVGAPADKPNVIAVGALGVTDHGKRAIAHFSSRGPAFDGRTKPDVAAPGTRTLSCVPDADNAYGYKSGMLLAFICMEQSPSCRSVA